MNTRKVWFITGASKGLGLTLAKRLLREGYFVAATSRNLSSLVQNIGEKSTNFLPLEVNLSDEKSIQNAVSATINHFNVIDVLVNNAGYGQGGSVEEVTDEEARKNYEVNVFGLLNVIRGVLPSMREKRSGLIYNISSIGGYVSAFHGWGIYCSTKFAVSGITEALHTDVKDLGINVSLVYPGYFRTNFLDKESMMLPKKPIDDYSGSKASMDHHVKEINANQPGDPEKAAAALIRMSGETNPPLHLFLGSDSYTIAKSKFDSFQKDIEEWKEVSFSTDF